MKQKLHIIVEYIKIKLFKVYKLLFSKTQYSKYQEDLYQNVKPGDIIYARMPFTDFAMAKIDEGHRNRPYLVMKKGNGYIYAYPCSHKKRAQSRRITSHVLLKTVYKNYSKFSETKRMCSDSWLSFETIHKLPIENIYYKSLTISEYDKQEIERKLVMNVNRRKKRIIRFHCDYSCKIGDIMKHDNQLWYVYQVDKNKLYVHPIKSKKTMASYQVKVFSDDGFVDTEEKSVVYADQNSDLIYFVEDEVIEEIARFKEERRIERKKNKVCFENDPLFKSISFLHSPGTVFYQPFSDEYVVYLYSLGKKNYGINYNEWCDGENLLRKLVNKEYLREEGNIDNEELSMMLEDLIRYNELESMNKYFKYVYSRFCSNEVSIN